MKTKNLLLALALLPEIHRKIESSSNIANWDWDWDG
jgi:hypothetical protein